MGHRGFSLVELLCVVGIAAVLAALASPAWGRLQARTAVAASAQQVMAGLALARRTALATGRSVTLCPTADLRQCGFGGREWMVFVNETGGSLGRRESGEPLLRRWPLPARVRVAGSRNHVWYLPQTRAAATTTFEFCHPGWPELRRLVVVSQTGRPRLSSGDPSSTPARSRCP